MTIRLLASILIGAAALAGCTSRDDSSSSSLSEVGSSVGQFRRSSDTLGTQRRMDVYGGATSPVLPTIGAPGYGK